MSHVWISASDGDLLRADQIRQINVVEGLRIVTIGGNQFLVAEVETRAVATTMARELAATIAEAETWSHASEIAVVRQEGRWEVRLTAMREADRHEAPVA